MREHLTKSIVFASISFLCFTSAFALDIYSDFDPAGKSKIAHARREYYAKGYPLISGTLLTSPGLVVGTTYYDYQSNGSSGDRIVLDSLGAVHYIWTKSDEPTLDDPRHIWYGILQDGVDLLPPLRVSLRTSAGYGAIDLLNGAVDIGVQDAAVIGYHNAESGQSRFAVDASRGAAMFDIDSTGFPGGYGECIWPIISIDRDDNVHAIASQSNAGLGELHYSLYSRRSYIPGSAWSTPVIFDSTYTLSHMITSSPISAKTAIIWTSPIFQDSNQFNNDVVYVESPDGIEWDFQGARENITNYPMAAIGDTTLRAYTDIDAVYDFNDELHIIWNAPLVTRDAGDDMVVLYKTNLYHWSPSSGINLIYEHPSSDWQCDMGGWNLPIAKMSIGVDADSNFLYTVFTRFDPEDFAEFDAGLEDHPCGGDIAMPCCNGELYMSLSTDGGITWVEPVNITNSPSPDCATGDCDNDNWASMADLVDDYLHIIYVNDKDAGGVTLFEGEPTENPVMYLMYPNPTRTSVNECNYLIGDINGSGNTNGLDVTYGVSFLKGGPPPPYACECGEHGVFHVACDVNGDCEFNGIDIIYLVGYLKGGPALVSCPDCPPSP